MSFTITTPIYYVNGSPHIGHAYTTTAADVATRFQRLIGNDAFFLTGTDEHGQKVYDAARERGLAPKAHCDELVVEWKSMMAGLGIRYDRFIRTTDPDHVANVRAVLQHLFDRELIYKDTYTGWYSKAAERFWTEKDLVDGKCPDSGQPVEEITESNYFFRMGDYQQQLVDHIQANPGFIQPEARRNEVLGFLRQKLEDLCISRPKERLAWGIELPFDRDYVTYVWFDALLNYLTGAGYTVEEGAAGLDRWPATFHLIGKDILTTHAVYWTTMLFALEVEPFQTLYAHGWWVADDGAKMSKSLGNVIAVDKLIEGFGVDAVRYFFLREIRFGADGGFSYDGFLSRYNVDLANDLGNLAHRGLSMTRNWLGGQIPESGERTEAEEALVVTATASLRTWRTELEALQFNKAIEAVLELVGAGNKYIEESKPWELNKNGDTERLGTVLRHVLEIAFFAGSLLSPVMPGKSEELLAKLGRSPDAARHWVTAALRADAATLDALPAGLTLEVGDPLFPRFKELPDVIQALFDGAPDSASEPATPSVPASSGKKGSAKAKEADGAGLISFSEFQRVALVAGRILSAADHPDADKLLVLQVDVGEEEPRQIVAGIKSRFAAAELAGRSCVVVANLQPAKLRGVVSQGMLLAAGAKEVVDLVACGAPPGTVVR